MAQPGIPDKMPEFNYYVYNRLLMPEDFEIHRSKRIEAEGFTADVWIVKSGHVLRFSAGKNAYTELAKADNGTIPSGEISRAKLAGDSYTYNVNEPEFAYKISARAIYIPEESTYAEKYFEIEELKTKGLFAAFPGKEEELLERFAAVTIIPDHGKFGIEAVHTFPEERMLVYTRSSIVYSGGQ